VLLVVNSWERAQELVDAGCKLVPCDSPARWTGDQIESLFSTLPDKVISKVGEKKDELLRLSTLSGTPGFLIFEAYSEQLPDARHAAMHDLEWRKGIRALYESRQELGTTRQDIKSLCEPLLELEPGRFPDRNGIYHHEDLRSLKIEAC
jgi:hypothetical protein